MEKLFTRHSPSDKPLMVWDGECPFCRYWIDTFKNITGDRVLYEPFQTASGRIRDLDTQVFIKAVRLIAPDGVVYGGAEAALRALYISGNYKWGYRLYKKSNVIRKLSDAGYELVASNRGLFFRLSTLIFGKKSLTKKSLTG